MGKKARIKGAPQFTIEKADYAADEVRVKEAIAKPEQLVGQVCVISGNGHSASYTVEAASEHTLRFQGPAITGLCVVEKNEAKTIVTKTRLSGYGTQLTARDLEGMALTGEDYAFASPIVAHSSGDDGLHLDLASGIETPDANHDGRTVAYFADYAPGYQVRFAPWIELDIMPGKDLSCRSNTVVEIE